MEKLFKPFILFLSIFFVSLLNQSFAQVSIGGTPMSFFYKNLSTEISSVRMPAVDVQRLLEEDIINTRHIPDMPYRFGSITNVNYNFNNSGTWDVLSDGSRIWRLRITSEGALSIYAIFNNFYLPEGAKLFAYNEDKSYVLGAFTSLNNPADLKYAIAPMPFDQIILEYYEPKSVAGQGKFDITQLVYGYKDVFGFVLDNADALSCNININCPIGAPWVDHKRSVAKMVYTDAGSSWLCTGSMINNTANDRKRYFLTAEHCSSDNYSTMVLFFNYENPTCVGDGGPTNMTVVGTTARASNYAIDVRLLEVNSAIPGSYNVFFNGWDRSGTTPTSEVAIHHPGGDNKKISIDNNSATNSNGFGGRLPNGFWQVIWDQGMTEGGSSGCPLYDQNKRVIGQNLGGAPSQCENPQVVTKVFGKFSQSWAYGGSASNQLKDWLDPGNTGAMTIDGIDAVTGIPPVSNFTSNVMALPFGGGTINFTDLTSNGPTSWSWSFPGGNPSSSTQRNPAGVSYANTGRYTVSLTTTNANGSNTKTMTGYVTVAGVTMNNFSLVSPSTQTTVVTSAGNSSLYSFKWRNSASNPTINYKLKIRKIIAGAEEYIFQSNNNGLDTTGSIRISQLDSIAAAMGTTGDSVRCIWRAWVFNGLDSLASIETFFITLRRKTIGIEQISSTIPDKFLIHNNYPNPFNPTTKIKLDINKAQFLKVTIFDMVGKEVTRLYENNINAGSYVLEWNAQNSPSGIYFFRVETPEMSTTRRMVLLK